MAVSAVVAALVAVGCVACRPDDGRLTAVHPCPTVVVLPTGSPSDLPTDGLTDSGLPGDDSALPQDEDGETGDGESSPAMSSSADAGDQVLQRLVPNISPALSSPPQPSCAATP